MQIPDHPPLRPCPFCGRPGSVSAYRAAEDKPVTYTVGCFMDADPFAAEHYWDDCLGPQSSWLEDLARAVELWNTRGKPAGRG